MTDGRITIVTGLGRCGTSMAMQMLAAGGYPVIGERPAYERQSAIDLMHNAPQPAFAGVAVKVLDLLYNAPHPEPAYRFVLLTRDHREQAKSQFKFLSVLGGLRVKGGDLRRVRKSLDRELPKLRRLLDTYRAPIMEESFERALSEPKAFADRLAGFVGRELDTCAMARAVISRSPRCYDGLMELNLIDVGAAR